LPLETQIASVAAAHAGLFADEVSPAVNRPVSTSPL
jgi:hypothetical protein